MFIYSNKIYTTEGCISGFLEIEDGKIKDIISKENKITAYIDYSDFSVIPGIIDTHNHGAFGCRFDNGNIEDILTSLKGQASFGVTGVLATLQEINNFSTVSKLSEQFIDGTQILGIHSEGPWGSRVGEKGVNTGYPKVDLSVAKEMIKLANGRLLLVDIAPEVDNAIEAIDYFISQNITVGCFHTNATYQEANVGFEHGISVATHLLNVMTGLHHRNIGCAGAAILNDNVYCELICDGLHVCLPMVELIFKMKDFDKIMMISDNGAYLGAPVGKYKGDLTNAESDRKTLTVTSEGFVLSETGRLSGSSKSVIYGMKNLVKELKIPLEEVIKLSSLNPSIKYKFTSKGSIEKNKAADLVIIDDNFDVQYTYCEGKCVFDKSIDKITFNKNFLNEKKI